MTEIKLYNTKTKTKEVFTPLDKDNVRMYVCGPTVYDRAHIGNARPVVVFDVLYRLLRHVFGADHVTYARNFTDVDDKINAKAAETGRSIRDITDETIGWFLEDMGALGALEPDKMPRATEYIPEMTAMIEELIAKGHAYAAEGHVLFDVNSYAAYGALSGRSVDDMIAGARVEVAPYKRNPMDFVLWKPSSGDQPGWDSPWGYGRPGWHVECSAMSRALFGETFDIHGGGLDLQFPHHENEIAQSCACCGEDTFARVWMHNEMLQVEGKKMSKSLGNFFSVRELLDKGYPGEVIRFVFLSTHYSKPMDWTEKKAEEARIVLSNLYDDLEGWLEVYHAGKLATDIPAVDNEIIDVLSDDLNTSLALSLFRKKAKKVDFTKRNEALTVLANGLFLGFFQTTQFPTIMARHLPKDFQDIVDGMIVVRNVAKMEKDFAKADLIRDSLDKAGVFLKDGQDGTKVQYGPDFDPSKLETLK